MGFINNIIISTAMTLSLSFTVIAMSKGGNDSLTKGEKKAQEICGSDKPDGTYLFVVFRHLKNDEGNIRVHVYPDNEKEFLKGGYGFKKDVKTKKSDNTICMPMPAPGKYAVALMHDRNGNGKADVFKEGFGFSNNIKLGLRKPKLKKALMTVKSGKTTIVIKMQYLFGSSKKKEERRRRMRRN